MTATVRAFIDAADARQIAEPARLAADLRALAPSLTEADEDTAELIRLAEHVLLGHLGRPDEFEAWLRLLPPALQSAEATAQSVQRATWALAMSRGISPAGPAPQAEGRWRALQNVILALAWQGRWEDADRLLAPAEAEAASAGAAPARQAYAATANNVAQHLRLLLPRSASRNVLMLDAASSARRAWERAGTWLHVERAEYQLAVCHAAADRAPEALRHATLCLALCESENADALERFYAHEALARAHAAALDLQAAHTQAAQMQTLLPQIDAASRDEAQRVLDELRLD